MEALMRRDLLRTGAFALAFAGSVGISAAQQPSPPADAQQRSQQDKAQQTPSGKTGKEEPSSQAATAQPQQNAVFVNGALTVPDAPANTDTTPAKFSQKNAADDELITIAYTFKTLSDDERRAIYEALKGQPAGSAFNADIGTELPSGIELRPVPDDLAARVPQTKDYSYAVTQDRVLLVGTSRVVAGVFADANVPVSAGRRGP
jgi:glucose/arabinose dehydrogenase